MPTEKVREAGPRRAAGGPGGYPPPVTWWMWVLLVLAALVVLGLLGYRLFRQAKALLREVGAASRRVADTQAESQRTFDAWRAARVADDAAYLATLERDVR